MMSMDYTCGSLSVADYTRHLSDDGYITHLVTPPLRKNYIAITEKNTCKNSHMVIKQTTKKERNYSDDLNVGSSFKTCHSSQL